MRWTLVLLAALAFGCSLLDSVDDYGGPPSGGSGGSTSGTGASGGSGGSGGWPSGGGSGGSATGGSSGAGAGGSAATGGGSTGGSGGCTSDTECSDGDVCNGIETCGAGICSAGIPPTVDDDNPCTTDYCDSKKGVQHVAGSYPPIKQCLSVTNVCPSDYYRAFFACCDPECGACPYGVNAQSCERACTTEVQVCCGIAAADCDSSVCPSGYTKGNVVSSGCVCGVESFAVICKR